MDGGGETERLHPGEPGSTGAGRPASPAVRWVLALVVFLAACAPFLPALSQGFVALDDDYNFEQNEHYRGLGAENLAWMFTESHMGHYQPLSWLTLAIDYELYGLDGAGYHLTNLIFHGLGMVALYWLAHALLALCFPGTDDRRLRVAAAAAALLHAMHPLRVESVAWATERRDVQSGLFLILTVLAYLRWRRSAEESETGGARPALLAVSLLCFVVSLLSKAWGITLPAVLLVLDVWPLRRLRERSLVALAVEKLWYAVPAAAVAWLAAWAQGEAAARASLADHTVLERLVQAAYGLWFYPWKTLWPTDLAALYWLEEELDPLRGAHLAAYAFVLVATVAALALRRRLPALLAAWVTFGLVVSPVLGFLQSGFQKVADRYSYLACIPFALLAGAGLVLLGRRRPAASGPALAAVVVLLGVLGTLSWRQTLVWKDSETLYAHLVEVEPHNGFAWHMHALMHQRAGRLEEALEAERRSVEVWPGKGNLPAWENLATLYRSTGRADELHEVWRGIVEQAVPYHHEALTALEAHHARGGDLSAMVPHWERSVRALYEQVQVEDTAMAKHAIGSTLMKLDQDEEAQRWLELAFQQDNKLIEVAVDYGRVLARTGQPDVAQNLLTQVLGAAPGHPRAQAALRAIQSGRRP